MEKETIFIKEYLESLSEDKELDRLMPILLRVMGFVIVRTAVETKGRIQHGKDIIAIRTDPDRVRRRYYFEIKGHSDKDITEASISKGDGIKESLTAAYFAKYSDISIPGFNDLPVRVVLVHNGVLDPGAKDVLEGILLNVFNNPHQEFERWDIYYLTELFSKYLFQENLLTDPISLKLFKRTLVLLDQPEYDLNDFKDLIIQLLENDHKQYSRALNKLFATLKLLLVMLWHYSKENKNLNHAMNGVSFAVLRTWGYILRRDLAKRAAIQKHFRTLLQLQRDLLSEYFNKTLPIAQLPHGLFNERGGPFEEIGYSLRSMDYVAQLVYYFQLINAGPDFKNELSKEQLNILQSTQKALLIKIVANNRGAYMPVLDRHSRPILLFVLFVLDSIQIMRSEAIEVRNYLIETCNQISLIRTFRDRHPEAGDNLNRLIEFVASGKRPFDYSDDSSFLLPILLELISIFNDDDAYQTFCANYRSDSSISFQTAYPDWSKPREVELGLFMGSIYNLTLTETIEVLPDTRDEFVKLTLANSKGVISYDTDVLGFFYLRTLSYIYFHNDVPPETWRRFLAEGLFVVNNTPN